MAKKKLETLRAVALPRLKLAPDVCLNVWFIEPPRPVVKSASKTKPPAQLAHVIANDPTLKTSAKAWDLIVPRGLQMILERQYPEGYLRRQFRITLHSRKAGQRQADYSIYEVRK